MLLDDKIREVNKKLAEVNTLLLSIRRSAGDLTHNILSATHLDTLADTIVAGDILIGNATPKLARLPKDANDKILKLVAGFPSWEVEAGGGVTPAIGLKVFDSDFDSLANGNINGQGAYSYAGTWVNNSGADCSAEIMADPGGGKMLRLMMQVGRI